MKRIALGKLVIEQGIPLPTGKRGRRRGSVREAYDKMNPGDSVVIPSAHRAVAQQIAHRLWGKGGYRTMGISADETRVWRVA